MKAKISEALKTRYKTLGFTDRAFDGVADYLSKIVTKDEEVDGIVTGAEPLLKAFQGDADKRVTEALAKVKPPEPPQPPVKPDEKPAEQKVEAPDWVKTLIDTNKSMMDKIAALELNQTLAGQHSRIKSKLEEAKVPEIYYSKLISGRTFKDDTEIETFTGEVVTGWDQIKQSLADESLGQSHKPILGSQQKDGVSQRVKDFLDAKDNPEKSGDTLGGKKL